MTTYDEESAIDFDDTIGGHLLVQLLALTMLAVGLLVGASCWYVHLERGDVQVYSLVVAQQEYAVMQLKLNEDPSGYYAGQAWYFVPELGENCTSPFSYFEKGQPTFLARLLHTNRRIMIYLEREICISKSLPVSTY